MPKKLYIFTFLILITLIQIQIAAADFLIANGSATEDAWVVYSTWQPADANLPTYQRDQARFGLALCGGVSKYPRIRYFSTSCGETQNPRILKSWTMLLSRNTKIIKENKQ